MTGYDGAMPRATRAAAGGVVYHVLNRASGRRALFKRDEDYALCEKVLAEAHQRVAMRTVGYCVMPNHWHLLLWPRGDGDLSEFMRWLTVTHTQRWHAGHGTAGTGHVYQGRFKSFPVQRRRAGSAGRAAGVVRTEDPFWTLLGYVERSALRAGLVARAEDWRWSSLWRRTFGGAELRSLLTDPPASRRTGWRESTNKKARRRWCGCANASRVAARSDRLAGSSGPRRDWAWPRPSAPAAARGRAKKVPDRFSPPFRLMRGTTDTTGSGDLAVRFGKRKILFALITCVVLLALGLVVLIPRIMASIQEGNQVVRETVSMCALLCLFAEDHGRMPAAIEELYSMGYLKSSMNGCAETGPRAIHRSSQYGGPVREAQFWHLDRFRFRFVGDSRGVPLMDVVGFRDLAETCCSRIEATFDAKRRPADSGDE